MADFGVVAVRYSPDRSHIEYVRLARDLPGKFGPFRIVARGFVADLINMNKATFKTWVKNSQGNYSPGADIHVIDEEFLSTDRNSRKRDNLGNLPEF